MKDKTELVMVHYYCLFVMPPWLSPLFTVFSHKKKNESLHRTYTLLIDPILLSYSFNSSQKRSLKFLFF